MNAVGVADDVAIGNVEGAVVDVAVGAATDVAAAGREMQEQMDREEIGQKGQ